MALAGRATATGTARYAQRFLEGGPARNGFNPVSRAVEGHFRPALGLTLSSIGCGTYLGEVSDTADERYRVALEEAIRRGCNVLDTAVNYRAQHSEVAVGRAVADLVTAGEFAREELVIASKGGFIAYGPARASDRMQYVYDNFIATGVADPQDLAGGIHCMVPEYLSQQISWSLRNTGLHSLDIYYLHNPETQLAFVDRATFRKRLQLAFDRLEQEVVAGRIGCYGAATWEGLRRPPMSAGYISLEIMVRLAEEVGGSDHHLRAVQFPLNANLTECAIFRNQPVGSRLLTALEAANALGLSVITSASTMQGQILGRVPAMLAETFPGLQGNVVRALQFTRSMPGVTTALVGMGRPEHVRENLALASTPPEPEAALRLAQVLTR